MPSKSHVIVLFIHQYIWFIHSFNYLFIHLFTEIAHFRYPSQVIMNKAIQNEAQGKQRGHPLICSFVSPGPRFELLCSWSLDQDMKSRLFSYSRGEFKINVGPGGLEDGGKFS